MKLSKTNKFKSLILVGTLAISLLFGGCSDSTQVLGAIGTNLIQKESDKGSAPEGVQEATVERVVDGDTIKVKLKGSVDIVTLRLLLIDTPESVKPGVNPQPYSLEASNFAKESIKEGDSVYLEYDDGDKTDRYGRHLCYLWFYSKEENTWKMFNETLVEKGLARVGYIYSQKRHLDALYIAQDKAKSNKLNIWSIDGYVTDKGFDIEAYNNKKTSSISKNSLSSDNYSNNSNKSSYNVYANLGSSSSNKYHSSATSHGMKGAVKMSQSKAEAQGYEPCGLCY